MFCRNNAQINRSFENRKDWINLPWINQVHCSSCIASCLSISNCSILKGSYLCKVTKFSEEDEYLRRKLMLITIFFSNYFLFIRFILPFLWNLFPISFKFISDWRRKATWNLKNEFSNLRLHAHLSVKRYVRYLCRLRSHLCQSQNKLLIIEIRRILGYVKRLRRKAICIYLHPFTICFNNFVMIYHFQGRKPYLG